MEQMCISTQHQILRKGKMNSSEQWGPPLWKLFHMLAEQSGKQTDESLQRKESSLWAALISETKNITYPIFEAFSTQNLPIEQTLLPLFKRKVQNYFTQTIK